MFWGGNVSKSEKLLIDNFKKAQMMINKCRLNECRFSIILSFIRFGTD